jgi:hypothetical protein
MIGFAKQRNATDRQCAHWQAFEGTMALHGCESKSRLPWKLGDHTLDPKTQFQIAATQCRADVQPSGGVRFTDQIGSILVLVIGSKEHKVAGRLRSAIRAGQGTY